jgi:hypothetical protein
LNLTPTAGAHTLKIVVDVNNAITESDESDNTWEHAFTWTGTTTQPNLLPIAPTGWDYPIVPSSVTGTHTVSTLYTTQPTYIDWAVGNSGASTTTTFANCLYYDNSSVHCWNVTDGLDLGYYVHVEDWVLNLTPTAGAHTLKIVVDVNNAITESDESDNTWEHSFTWGSTTRRVYLPLVLRDNMAYFEGPWEQEPNDTYLQANGPLHSERDYYGYPDDLKDYFSIYLTTGGHIIIDLSNQPSQGVQLQLFYQTTATPPIYSQTSAPYHIDYLVNAGETGWYYVYIYFDPKYNYNSNTAYTLRVTYP